MIRYVLPFLLVLAAGAATAQQGQQDRTITVTGTGEVSAAPDIAFVSVGVTQEADEARAALTAMNEAAAAVIDRLRAEGVAEEDLQTGALRLDPVYDNSREMEPRVRAYRASTTLTLRVRDLDRLGTLLDTVVTDGANQLSELRFDIENPRTLLDEARRRAVAEARGKAELLAGATGVALGDLVQLSESDGGRPIPMAMMRESASDGVPLAAGDVTVSASVTLVYAIGE